MTALQTDFLNEVVENDDHFTQQEFDAISGRWQNFATAKMVSGEGKGDALGLGVGSLINIAPAGTRTFSAFEGSHFLIRQAAHVVDDGVYSLTFAVNAEGAPPLLPPRMPQLGSTEGQCSTC